MIQQTLDGFEVAYTCKRCKRFFSTMSQIKIHQASTHKKYSKTKITISFALENFCLISTKRIEVIEN